VLAQPEQPGLWPYRRVVEVGVADRPEQDGVKRFGCFQRFVRDGLAFVPERRPAYLAFLVAHLDA
jgi:hypothetical protein